MDNKEGFKNLDVLRNSSHAKLYDWLDPSPGVEYTPFHWFSFWDDYRSVRFLLNIAAEDKNFEIAKLLHQNVDEMTALDIAGKHRSDKAALVILDYFRDNFYKLAFHFNEEKEVIKVNEY